MVNQRGALRLLAPALALILAALVISSMATVIVGYPIGVTAGYVENDVKLDFGSNSNKAGLAGNTITVSIGANASSATITIHLTYGKVMYIDILRINNSATAPTYYIGFDVSHNLPATIVTRAELIVDTGTGTVSYDILTGGWSGWLTTIDPGSEYEIHFIFEVAEGQKLPTTTSTINLRLYWSPSDTETPIE